MSKNLTDKCKGYVTIENASDEIVDTSFPNFRETMRGFGFEIYEIREGIVSRIKNKIKSYLSFNRK